MLVGFLKGCVGSLRLTKLILDQKELSITARYSVRIDQTIVVEPLKQITEDTFKRILTSKSIIQSVGIHSPERSSLLKFEGPYIFERLNGILIFKPSSA